MSHHYSGPALGFPHGDARLDLTDLYAFGKPGDGPGLWTAPAAAGCRPTAARGLRRPLPDRRGDRRVQRRGTGRRPPIRLRVRALLAGEGTLMTFLPDPRKNSAATEVVKRFKDRGIEPEGFVLYTYAALQAWTQAAQTAGTTDMGGVVKALNENEFDTGSVSSDSTRRVTPTCRLMPSMPGLTEPTRRSAMRPRHLPVSVC